MLTNNKTEIPRFFTFQLGTGQFVYIKHKSVYVLTISDLIERGTILF